MDKQEAIAEGLQLLERTRICLAGTNGENGFPNINCYDRLQNVTFGFG